MTTIERARKFHKRITGYQVMMEPEETALIRSLYAQARVARALLKREIAHYVDSAEFRHHGLIYAAGLKEGLYRAIDILDAVYGRKK